MKVTSDAVLSRYGTVNLEDSFMRTVLDRRDSHGCEPFYCETKENLEKLQDVIGKSLSLKSPHPCSVGWVISICCCWRPGNHQPAQQQQAQQHRPPAQTAYLTNSLVGVAF